jgi:hypothetical protein
MVDNGFRLAPPQYVLDTYKDIRNSNLISNKSIYDGSIEEFRDLLNKAQPQSKEDVQIRSLIQYLYRRNPNNFCRYLIRSRLSHLILWTEAKCIVRHFGLRGIVYVKWNSSEYECSLHRHVGSDTDENTIKQILSNIGCDEFENNRKTQYRGGSQYNCDSSKSYSRNYGDSSKSYSRNYGDSRGSDRYNNVSRTRDGGGSRGRCRNYDDNRYSKTVKIQTDNLPPMPNNQSTTDFPTLDGPVKSEVTLDGPVKSEVTLDGPVKSEVTNVFTPEVGSYAHVLSNTT